MKSTLPPKQYAMALSARDDRHFARQVCCCRDIDRLRAYQVYEYEKRDQTRQDRIATVNKRIKRLKQIQ